jgi:hypothetical protein
MVKGYAQRAAKYAAKNSADAVRIRFADMKVSMDTNAGAVQSTIYDTQKMVRDTLDSYGVAAILSGAYQAVGMKCMGKKNRFASVTLTNEITRVLNDYSVQGLDEDVLAAIGLYFGVVWTAP